MGAVGSWFCNCVISSVRKLLRLPLSDPSAEFELDDVVEAVGVVVVVADTVTGVLLSGDVDAGAK
jgi:hypothetical protein